MSLAGCGKAPAKPSLAVAWHIETAADRMCAELFPCPARRPGDDEPFLCSLDGVRKRPAVRVGELTVESVSCRFRKMGGDAVIGYFDDRTKRPLSRYDLLHATASDPVVQSFVVEDIAEGSGCQLGEDDAIACGSRQLLPICAKAIGSHRSIARVRSWQPSAYAVPSDQFRNGETSRPTLMQATVPLRAGGRNVVTVDCSAADSDRPSATVVVLEGDLLTAIEPTDLLDKLDTTIMKAAYAESILRHRGNMIFLEPAGVESKWPEPHACAFAPGPRTVGQSVVFYATSTNAGTSVSRCEIDRRSGTGSCVEVTGFCA